MSVRTFSRQIQIGQTQVVGKKLGKLVAGSVLGLDAAELVKLRAVVLGVAPFSYDALRIDEYVI